MQEEQKAMSDARYPCDKHQRNLCTICFPEALKPAPPLTQAEVESDCRVLETDIRRAERYYGVVGLLSVDPFVTDCVELLAREFASVRSQASQLETRAATIITNACQLMDSIRTEWEPENCWSEWDQSVRATASDWLKDYYRKVHG
jgi:hypothetical protein